MKIGGTQTESTKEKIRLSKLGNKHWRWQEDEVTYSAIHKWLRRTYGTPSYCEHCKSTKKKKYDWAKKTDCVHARNKDNYIRLCRQCHQKYDDGCGTGKRGKDIVKRKKKVLSITQKNKNFFLHVYTLLKNDGKKVSPRGLNTIEIQNFGIKIPPYIRFCNFETRHLKVDYIKTEFKWYLKGDKYDVSIAEHATLWKGMINNKGLINSNYGQYIFGELNQFDFVVNELSRDKDSRRAGIMILQPYHTISDDLKDVPCTYGLNFRIRNNKLNMTVKMRSQDSYFGLGSDIPIFSFIHEMMYVTLKEKYPELEYGEYYHFVESFHIYERHFAFLYGLSRKSKYEFVDCPKISSAAEVKFLRALQFTDVPESYLFTKWILNN